LQLLWLIGISIYRIRQALVVGASSAVEMMGVLAALLIVSFALQFANVAVYSNAWIYVIGVVFQLAVGFMVFATLLLDRGGIGGQFTNSSQA